MSKKALIILLVCFLVIVAGAGAGLFILWNRVSQATPGAAGDTENTLKKEAVRVPTKALLSLDTFVVNLADPGGKRYLRVTMTLELKDKDLLAEVKKAVPRMRDRVLLILPAKKFVEIRTAEGKESLRKEIIAQLNPLLEKNEITDLYFQEFVVQ